MAAANLSDFLNRLTRGMAAEALGDHSDRQLVERLLAGPDPAVFEAVVRRHGPMVYRVCRRVLRQDQDCEDAFQATFLLLAQKLRTVRKHASLASWLHGVAHRVALKARARAATRRRHERRARAPAVPSDETPWGELRTALDAELAALPEKWRLPLVLCYLEGRTQDEAAGQLGWGKSTLRRRLDEARSALGRRLRRRGFWPAALSAVLLADCAAGAALSPDLIAAIAEAGTRLAAGAAAAVPARVAALAKGVRTPMLWTPGKVAAALVVGVGVLALAASPSVYRAWAGTPAANGPLAAQPPAERPREQAGPGQAPSPLAGRWLMTLPAGFQRLVQVRDVGPNRYAFDNAARFSGVYERRGARLVLVIPASRGEGVFAWEPRGAGELMLVAQPPPAKTGQDYRGALLERVPDGAGQGQDPGARSWDPGLLDGGYMFADAAAFREYLRGADGAVVGTLKQWDGDKGVVQVAKDLRGQFGKEVAFAYAGGLVGARPGDRVLAVLRRDASGLRLHSFCAASGLYRHSDRLQGVVRVLLAAAGPGGDAGAAQAAPGGERYVAYWLTRQPPDPNSTEYEPVLLIARLPLEKLPGEYSALLQVLAQDKKGHGRPPVPLLEGPALTVETYQKDSIWNPDLRPFKPIRSIGKVRPQAHEVVLNGKTYRYEACPLPDVIRLLEHPEGRLLLHRLHAPLAGADQTARALRLLLQEQLAAGQAKPAAARGGPAGGPFTDASAVLAVARDDQTQALKTRLLRREVTVADVVKALTTYRVVTREQYLEYDHRQGATGSVTVKGLGTCLWEIEPGYAAVVTLPRGRRQVYLLPPNLKVPERSNPRGG